VRVGGEGWGKADESARTGIFLTMIVDIRAGFIGISRVQHTLRRLQHRMQLCCVWQGKRHRRLRRLWQPIRLPLPLLHQPHGLLPRQLMPWRLMTHLGRQSVGLFAHVHARGGRAGQHRQWITHVTCACSAVPVVQGESAHRLE
jgi:hypothetical protein